MVFKASLVSVCAAHKAFQALLDPEALSVPKDLRA